MALAMSMALGLAAVAQDTTGNAAQTDASQTAAPQTAAAAPAASETMPAAAPAAMPANAQTAVVDGMVIGRDGPAMSVRTVESPRLIVVLSDTTKATEKGGVFGWSHRDLGIELLVPGLAVRVEGTYDSGHRLVAKKITFSRNSMMTAKQIDAGLNPVNQQLLAEQDQLRSDRRDIESGKDALDQTNQNLAATTAATGVNTQAIGKTNDRIGTLDQFDTKDSLTVNFANGKSALTKKDRDQLTEFVKMASGTPGYMIEVQGYASKVGSAALNQRLSAERADAVLAVIQQTGVVPMTRILAPAAMGTSNEVSSDHTRSGQAQNRRVVVTVVVNRGIAQQQESLMQQPVQQPVSQ
jgi:OOP family OmpA-OmpF porin